MAKFEIAFPRIYAKNHDLLHQNLTAPNTKKYVFRSFRLSDPENISTCSLDRQMVAPSTSRIATLNTQSLFYPFQMDGQLADFSQDYACIIVMLLAGNKQSFMTIHTGNGFTKGAINSAN